MVTAPDRCVLCHHPGSQRQQTSKVRVWEYTCPRCGDYYVSTLLYERNHFIFEEGWFPLACVAFEWHLRHKHIGNAKFVLTDDGMLSYSPYEAFPQCQIFTPDDMLEAFPKGTKIIERAMLNLAALVKHPVDRISWDMDILPYALFTEADRVAQMVGDLQELGYIRSDTGTASQTGLRIKPMGWDRVEKWQQPDDGAKSRRAFVAMWICEDMESLYRDAIAPAITKAGYESVRIDLKEHNNKICDEIVAEIRKSRFVVADFTGQRGGVYFEAGYAMGMGLPVIWIVRKDEVDALHFDTRQYNHIAYDSADDLAQKLYNRIAATIR